MVAAARQKAIEQRLVHFAGGAKSLIHALGRIAVEIDIGRPERQIAVAEDHLALKQISDRPADIVGDGRGADAAARANDGGDDMVARGRRIGIVTRRAQHALRLQQRIAQRLGFGPPAVLPRWCPLEIVGCAVHVWLGRLVLVGNRPSRIH